MKKIIWTVIFVMMGFTGSLALFGIADIWSTVSNWWTDSLSPLWKEDPVQISDWFAFIGGTIWTMIVVAPIWYLWKGTGVFVRGGIFALVIRILFIVLLYFMPTLFGILSTEWAHVIGEDVSWVNTANIVITWIIIGIAILGLWLRS